MVRLLVTGLKTTATAGIPPYNLLPTQVCASALRVSQPILQLAAPCRNDAGGASLCTILFARLEQQQLVLHFRQIAHADHKKFDL